MSATSEDDLLWMNRALELAARAGALGEVPVGAVVVRGGRVLGEAHNLCEARRDPTAHAEMLALRAAFDRSGAARLIGATMFSTLEPCFMCSGALVHARVERVCFAARDPKFGACVSLYELPVDTRLNHRFAVDEGPCAPQSAELLREFFRGRR